MNIIFSRDSSKDILDTKYIETITDFDGVTYTIRDKNAGTITGITMNGSSKGTSGVVDLGTVITDVSDKQDKLTAGSNIQITNNVISATDTTYTAGNGLTLTGTEFSANVTDNVTSTSTTNALSANMGKELQDQIDNLKARGRYLSQWNATTGLAATQPTTLPYDYKAGDYFIVGTVGTTNYKPNGSEYTGTASTTVETAEVAVEDVYYYDGSVWHLQQNTQKTVSFANLAGQPTDNTNLASALNAKQDTISDLATIRSNASAGKVASDTISGYGDIVTHNTSEFATSAQGILADTAIQPNDNISELNNNAGYITGITSGDVTAALGYTPYSSTNPSGYITADYHDSTKQDKLTAGTDIDITNNTVSFTGTIPTKTSDLTNDSDYVTSAYHDSTKQDVLTAGTNISIIDNVVGTSAATVVFKEWRV